MHNSGVLGATIVALALSLAACGESSGEPEAPAGGESPSSSVAPSTSPDPDEARRALRRAVEELAELRVVGDPDQITAEFSDYCQRRLIAGWFVEYLEVRELGYPLRPEMVSFTSTIDGENAHVTYQFADAPRLGAREEKWYLQDGEWRYDECFD